MSGQVPGKSKAQAFFYWILQKTLPVSARRWLSACIEPSSPLVLGLTDTEKAKADYEHEMKLREIGLDKGIFAIILAVVGATGIYCGNRSLDDRRTEAMAKLEEFRTKEAGRQSLLKTQLPELFAINAAMSEVTAVYFNHAGEKKPDNESEIKKEYKTALKKAAHVINRSPFLFDVEFNKDVDWYHAVHANMSRLPIEKWEKYRNFAEDLSNQFDYLCRSVIEGQRDDPQKRFRMPLKEMKPEERRKLSPEKRVEKYYQHWLKHKKD